MKVYYTDNFTKKVRKLDVKQQAKLTELVVLLKESPFNPLLHVKKLSGQLIGMYSLRINRDSRALFTFLSPDEIILSDVDNRKDIYR